VPALQLQSPQFEPQSHKKKKKKKKKEEKWENGTPEFHGKKKRSNESLNNFKLKMLIPFFPFWGVPGFKLRPLRLLGKHSATLATTPSCFALGLFFR
jgi:hypothetical protein